MGVNIICAIEHLGAGGGWSRAEKYVEATEYEIALAEDPEYPPLKDGRLALDTISINRNTWIESIHEYYGSLRGLPVDATKETIAQIKYWCDESLGESWLLLAEIEKFKWEWFKRNELSLNQWQNLLNDLRDFGNPEEVRIIYGWNA